LIAGFMENTVMIESDKGSAQGGPISPIIGNVYLHYALDLWFEKVMKRNSKGFVSMARYADDGVPRRHRAA
jgi:retron-type reverse transcriptase